MDDNERRKWLAGLRPFDRVAYRWGFRYLRGCTLGGRGLEYDDGDALWGVAADGSEYGIEPNETRVLESDLEPLPYPGFTGFVDLDPPKPRRRRSRARAAANTSA